MLTTVKANMEKAQDILTFCKKRMKSLEKQLKKSNNMDSTTRAHIDHANKEEWTKKELATLSDEQKKRLGELVFHMNPEIRQLGPKSKNKWILILSGIYIRYLR